MYTGIKKKLGPSAYKREGEVEKASRENWKLGRTSLNSQKEKVISGSILDAEACSHEKKKPSTFEET